MGVINSPKLQSFEPHVEEPLLKNNTMMGQVFPCNVCLSLQVDTFLISSYMHIGISTISPLSSKLSLFVATVVFACMWEGMIAETVDKERE